MIIIAVYENAHDILWYDTMTDYYMKIHFTNIPVHAEIIIKSKIKTLETGKI